MAMTNELTRWRQRPDHGDVIKSPRGEFVLWEDYDKLSKEFSLAEEGLANATQELNQRDAYIAKLHAARGSTPLENHIASLDIYEEHEGLRAISPAKVLQIVEVNEQLRADISQAYDLRDKAEGRFGTALMEIDRLKRYVQIVESYLDRETLKEVLTKYRSTPDGKAHEPAKDSMTCGCGVAGCNGSGVPPAQSKSGHEPTSPPKCCCGEHQFESVDSVCFYDGRSVHLRDNPCYQE